VFADNAAHENRTAIRIFNLITAETTTLLTEQSTTLQPPVVHAVHFNATGDVVFCQINEETTVHNLTTKQKSLLGEYGDNSSLFNPHVIRNCMSQDRTRYTCCTTEGIHVIDVATLSQVYLLPLAENSHYKHLALAADGKQLAVYVQNKNTKEFSMQIWEVDSANKLAEWQINQNSAAVVRVAQQLQRILFSPDNSLLLVAGGYAEGPLVLNTITGEIVHTFTNLSRADRLFDCFSMAISHSGQILAVGSMRAIYLFDLQNNYRPLVDFDDINDRSYKLMFSQDDTKLLAGGDAGSLQVIAL
jgi:WD40 repeat protein